MQRQAQPPGLERVGRLLESLEERYRRDLGRRDHVAQLAQPVISGFNAIWGTGANQRIRDLVFDPRMSYALDEFAKIQGSNDPKQVDELLGQFLSRQEVDAFKSLEVPSDQVFGFLGSIHNQAGRKAGEKD